VRLLQIQSYFSLGINVVSRMQGKLLLLNYISAYWILIFFYFMESQRNMICFEKSLWWALYQQVMQLPYSITKTIFFGLFLLSPLAKWIWLLLLTFPETDLSEEKQKRGVMLVGSAINYIATRQNYSLAQQKQEFNETECFCPGPNESCLLIHDAFWIRFIMWTLVISMN
jgi:hypothetical protein